MPTILLTAKPKLWLVFLACAATMLTFWASGTAVQAQQDEFILHSFTQSSNQSSNLTQGGDGNFYGTTAGGGSEGSGTVFKMTPGGQVTVLHSFPDPNVPNDGSTCYAPVVEGPGGSYYGTTYFGGSGSGGTVFKISPDGTYKILHSFPYNPTNNDGSLPYGGLVLGSDGNFYGTTSAGGAGHRGIVFKMTPNGQVSTLHSFLDGTVPGDGAQPESSLIEGSDHNFYGTAEGDDTDNVGIVFRISTTGSYKILHQFGNGGVQNDGDTPVGSLAEGSDGDFYGTTFFGGAGGSGTVFKVTPAGGTTILHSFPSGTTPMDGGNPSSGLVAGQDGIFYGTTAFGGGGSGNGNGTVFKITSAGKETILYAFNESGSVQDGFTPFGPLVLDNSGSLYGTTDSGGSSGYGTIFKMQITPPSLYIANVLFYPTRSASDYANGLVSLTLPAPAGGYLVHLSSSPYTGLVPAIVNVPEGLTSVSFPVQRVTADSSVSIAITAYAFGAGNKSATFLTP